MSMRFPIYKLATLALAAGAVLCPGQGIITTVAGGAGTGFAGDGGPATSAKMNQPAGVALDAAGNIYIADYFNHRVRKVSTSGSISTIAGTGDAGFSGDGGPAINAQLNYPWGIASDAAGNVYVTERQGHRVRKIDTLGVISTLAGTGKIVDSLSGAALGDGGLATNASLSSPFGVAVDGAGNVYIADTQHNRIRKVNAAGVISTFAGNGTQGLTGDGGPATSAGTYLPYGVGLDTSGNVYIAGLSDRLRKVNTNGVISTIAGGGLTLGDGGPATNALVGPWSVAVDKQGTIYIADAGQNRVRKIDSAGIISTFAGGHVGALGDGGPAADSNLQLPAAVALDGAGNLYIADTNHDRIRKVTVPAAAPVVAAAINGASFATNQSLAPGLLGSLFGTAIGSVEAFATTIPLPVSLGGASVTVGGIPAPLLYVTLQQINFQVPWTVASGPADIIVTVNGTVSAPFRASIAAVSPGIFSTQFGGGPAIAINLDGTLAGPSEGSLFKSHPAKPGDTIIILATGLGAVSPNIAKGAASLDALRSTTVTPQVLIGGAPAQVSFSGLSPQFVGVNQINVVVPNVSAGVVPLQLEEGGIRTSDKVTIAVGNP